MQKFRLDFEAEVSLRSWNSVKTLKLHFGQAFLAEVCRNMSAEARLGFWSWSLCEKPQPIHCAFGNVYVLISKFSESPSSWNTLFITLITGWNDFSFPQSSQKLQSFEAGLTTKLNKMGVEHFVTAPLPPTDHLQVKIMCISKSMKLITTPFSQTQGSVACGINIQ